MTITSSPESLGGYSLYHKNLIKYLKKNCGYLSINWVYFGEKNRAYKNEGVNYFVLKNKKFQILNHLSLARFFNKNNFDIINCIGGPWTFFYKKKSFQKIFQTFHGTVYYFNKNHLKRFNSINKVFLSPLLIFSWIMERPHKKTDKFLCVSEKVKRQILNLYNIDHKKIEVIRAGVDLSEFRQRNKNNLLLKLRLDRKKNYGLYIGGGGYWTKGLDRAVELSRGISKIDKNFKLIVIGPDYKKVEGLLKEKFIIPLKNIPREKMPYYYSISDFFLCMSRYEGGAPTLVVSEAMASKCLVICSFDSEQEIIENKKNGIVISKFDEKDVKNILELIKNKKALEKIKNNALETIKDLSLNKWGKRYVNFLFEENEKPKKMPYL